MIKVKALSRELCDGYPDGGADFYWEKGSSVVLIQEWEHRASGPVWSQVEVDPMSGDNLAEYIGQCWDNYIIIDVEEDHR
jgi:hypothetical protein